MFLNLDMFNRKASLANGEAIVKAVEYLKLPKGSEPEIPVTAVVKWEPSTPKASAPEVVEDGEAANIPVIRPEPKVESPVENVGLVFDEVMQDFG